jgi:serine/threonine protein phosphatase PrpC
MAKRAEDVLTVTEGYQAMCEFLREIAHSQGVWKHLGSTPVRPEIIFLAPQAGVRVLLCTDGLYGTLTGDQILAANASMPRYKAAPMPLCQFALDAGSKDNVSCIVVNVERNE